MQSIRQVLDSSESIWATGITRYFRKTHRICDNIADVFYCPLAESDCPVGGIVSDRSRNMESSRQLCVNAYFIGIIQVLSELEFYTLFSVTVGKRIILNVLVCPECLINTCVRLLNSDIVRSYAPSI